MNTVHAHCASSEVLGKFYIYVITGEPQRCIDSIRRWRDALGLTVVSGTFYLGGMPQEMARRNSRRSATEVMPAVAPAEALAP